jgi:hypothetical protein
MLMFVVAFVVGVLVWAWTRSSYRGHVNDLRESVAYERCMRRREEERAEVLSDALFGRTKTRQRSDTGMRN